MQCSSRRDFMYMSFLTVTFHQFSPFIIVPANEIVEENRLCDDLINTIACLTMSCTKASRQLGYGGAIAVVLFVKIVCSINLVFQ